MRVSLITFALLMYGPVPIIEIASDPKSDPEPEKQGRNKEGQPLGFGSFQVSKSLETLEVQQMDKPTAAHNPEVGGSSPPPATRNPLESPDSSGLFLFSATFSRGLFWVSESDPDSDPYGEKVRSRCSFSAPGPHCFSGVIFAVQRAAVSTRSMTLAASFCTAVVTWA